MKKSILLLIALSASVAGWSQTTQGSFTFGGGARYTTNKNSYDTNYKNNELIIRKGSWYPEETKYQGICPSINEFRYITENLLKIK